VCAIPACVHLDVWLHILLPALVAVAVLAIILLTICCLRRKCCHWTKKQPLPPGSSAASSAGLINGGHSMLNGSSVLNGGSGSGSSPPRSIIARTHAGSSVHNYSEMEMNALLPQQAQQPQPVVGYYGYQQPPQQQQPMQRFPTMPTPPVPAPPPQLPPARPREYPITSVRFHQEMGEGSYGKVYRGDLGGIVGGSSTAAVVKTLRPGADAATRADFTREGELWVELKHTNVVQLLGVVSREEPQCLIFELPGSGADLREFLAARAQQRMADAGSDDGASAVTIEERGLDASDMSFMAIQIAAGMEYLAGRNFVHRDLATRNILVGDNLTMKISDFGLSRDAYNSDYYRVQSKSLLPVRWMPPESILYGKFTTESDVWSFGVLLWEIYSFGLQPYYGYSNQEVIEMIRSRQLLPCPEDCPSRMYAFMVECWHEVPARRPQFAEIHARLRHWEGMSTGYQSTTSHASHRSNGSQHSSDGPSNNTGSTNVSQQFLLQQQQQQQQQNLHGSTSGLSSNGGYSRPFGHLMGQPKPPGTAAGLLQMAGGPGGSPHTVLVPGGGGPVNGGNPFLPSTPQKPSSAASLQMV